jgi:hypothetical protein
MYFWIPRKEPPLTELLQREMLPFRSPPTLSIISSQRTPQILQRAPTDRETPVSRAFFYTFPSKSLVNEPPLHVLQQGPYGERSFISRDNGLFIHLSESPIRSPSTKKRGKYLVTVHRAPHVWKAYLQHCNLYPSAMQPSARYLPPWLG